MAKESQKQNPVFLFEKINYQILVVGLLVVAAGFLLMAGGASDDPNVFN